MNRNDIWQASPDNKFSNNKRKKYYRKSIQNPFKIDPTLPPKRPSKKQAPKITENKENKLQKSPKIKKNKARKAYVPKAKKSKEDHFLNHKPSRKCRKRKR